MNIRKTGPQNNGLFDDIKQIQAKLDKAVDIYLIKDEEN